MTMSSTDRAVAAALASKGQRDDGVRVGQVCGVIGGVVGAAAVMAQGGSAAGALAGALAGGVVGYAAGGVWGTFEFNTTSKILSGAVSGLTGVAIGSCVAELVDCFVTPPQQ